MKNRLLIMIIFGIVPLVACTPEASVSPQPTTTGNDELPLLTLAPVLETQPAQGVTNEADPEPAPPSKASTTMRGIVERAKADLARHLAVPVQNIRTVETEAALWPDAGLGCPQPGLVYAETTTPGFWIVLAANEQTYSYHTDREGRVVLCERGGEDLDGRPPAFPVVPINPGEITDGEPWVPVD